MECAAKRNGMINIEPCYTTFSFYSPPLGRNKIRIIIDKKVFKYDFAIYKKSLHMIFFGACKCTEIISACFRPISRSSEVPFQSITFFEGLIFISNATFMKKKRAGWNFIAFE